MNIQWFDSNCFNIRWYNEIGFEEVKDRILESVAVFHDKSANANQRMAAEVLLRFYLTKKFYDQVIKELRSMLVGEVNDRSDPKVNVWRKAILSKGKCEICGSTEYLEAHHIDSWALCPERRIDVNNGMCLCHACHTKEHEFDPSYYMMKAQKLKGDVSK